MQMSSSSSASSWGLEIGSDQGFTRLRSNLIGPSRTGNPSGSTCRPIVSSTSGINSCEARTDRSCQPRSEPSPTSWSRLPIETVVGPPVSHHPPGPRPTWARIGLSQSHRTRHCGTPSRNRRKNWHHGSTEPTIRASGKERCLLGIRASDRHHARFAAAGPAVSGEPHH